MNTMGKRLLRQNVTTSFNRRKRQENEVKIEEMNLSKKIFQNIIDLEYYISKDEKKNIGGKLYTIDFYK